MPGGLRNGSPSDTLIPVSFRDAGPAASRHCARPLRRRSCLQRHSARAGQPVSRPPSARRRGGGNCVRDPSAERNRQAGRRSGRLIHRTHSRARRHQPTRHGTDPAGHQRSGHRAVPRASRSSRTHSRRPQPGPFPAPPSSTGSTSCSAECRCWCRPTRSRRCAGCPA